MAKQWVRQHQDQRDELQDVLETVTVWVSKNTQKALTIAGVAAAVIIVAAALAYRARSLRNSSWERLGLAESMAYAGRPDLSLQQIQQLTSEQPGSDAAAWAEVFAGDLAYQKGDYQGAAAQYLKVVERGSHVELLARGGLYSRMHASHFTLAEGAVAWLIAMVGLILVVRWIGERG